jgi:S1-C subfamily serine protease
VNQLDVVLVIVIVTAVVGGYRLGFLARATSWIGLVIGLLGASYFLPGIVGSLQDYEPSSRFLIAAGVFLGAAFLGQALGLVLGANLHRALPLRGPLRQIDRGAGGLAGVAGVLVTIWLLTPAMADVPGWPARQARSSRLAKAVSDRLPQPPDTLGALRRLVGDDNFPHVFGRFEAAPNAGPAPADSGLALATLNRVTASTVKVEGIACGRQQDGSGFTVAPDTVVTNAHVVAGEGQTEVIRPNLGRVHAVVTMFDSDRDLAVLRAPGLGLQPLPIGSAAVGATGAVFGHPRGQDRVEVSPAVIRQHVEAVGRDLYDSHVTRRQVFILAADLAPGDSGGALADAAGRVVGVAFAIAPDRPGTAYALTDEVLRAALAEPRGQQVGTGDCLTS